jgi:hypothetical protein
VIESPIITSLLFGWMRKGMYSPLLFTSTRLRIECDDRLRQSGTFPPIVVRFRAASAKTGCPLGAQKNGKYHAAADKYQLEAATA